jgi:hypothetical protein
MTLKLFSGIDRWKEMCVDRKNIKMDLVEVDCEDGIWIGPVNVLSGIWLFEETAGTV